MSLSDEIGKRFGGLKNALLLLTGVVLVMRFAGAEWHENGLEVQLLRSLWLFLGCFGVGLLFALGRLIASRIGSNYSRPPAVADVAWGLKYGFAVGVLLVFVTGVLLVDDYLKPFLDLWEATFGKLIEKIAG